MILIPYNGRHLIYRRKKYSVFYMLWVSKVMKQLPVQQEICPHTGYYLKMAPYRKRSVVCALFFLWEIISVSKTNNHAKASNENGKLVKLTTEQRVSVVTPYALKQSVIEVQNAFGIRCAILFSNHFA